MQTLSREENMLWIDEPSPPDSAINQSSLHIALVFLVFQHKLSCCNQKSNQNQSQVFKQCTWGQKQTQERRSPQASTHSCSNVYNHTKWGQETTRCSKVSLSAQRQYSPPECPDTDELCLQCSTYNPPQEVSHPPINRSHVQDPPTAFWGKVWAEIPKQKVVVQKLNSATIQLLLPQELNLPSSGVFRERISTLSSVN